MRVWNRWAAGVAALVVWGSLGAGLGRGAGAEKPPGELVVVDAAGKEHKVKTWKFLAGTRRLSWLADKGDEKTKPPAGPEALELREDNSTTLVDGILTLIPLEHVRAIEFDNDKKKITVRVVTGDKAEADEVLTGSTAFKQVNKFTLECEVDKGDLGVAAVKFLGGVPDGIRAVRFPAPKAVPAVPAGRAAVITGGDEKKTAHKTTNLQPLYNVKGDGPRLVPTLFFKKTLKVDVTKIQKVRATGTRAVEEPDWDVTLKDGDTSTLTLLAKSVTVDGKPATLLGLVGRVAAGYKLFPAPSIAEIQWEEAKP